jgi:hypothetical protein
MEDSSHPPKIGRSEWRHTSDGQVRRWPNREDYEDWYRHVGEIEPGVPFDEAYQVHAPVFLDWMARGQTACRFASVLSRSAEEGSWSSFTVTNELRDDELAEITDRVLRENMEKAELVQLLFPSVVSVHQLCALISNLTVPGSNWHWERTGESSDSIPVGLRWTLPSKQFVAWTVGFGPFDFLPFTRRAPITAIVVRTSETKRTKYDMSSDGMIPVHLADVDDGLQSADVRQKLTDATIAAKQNYLGGEFVDSARARVTFRIPVEQGPLLFNERTA